MGDESRRIRSLAYSDGKLEMVGIGGITKIREAEGTTEKVAGGGGWLTTYVVERHSKIWKIVPGWMVAVEFEYDRFR